MSRIRAFDFSVELLSNVLWQYDATHNLRGLIAEKEAWYSAEHSQYWNDWIVDVFNIDTANDFGLAVWAIILGIPLVVTPDPDPGKIAWGFSMERANFENGNFAATGGSFNLTTAQKRLVIQMRYFQLITRGAAPEVNAFLNRVFGPGECYVEDTLNMHIFYVFTNPVPSALALIFDNYDLLPRPAGVGVTWISGEIFFLVDEGGDLLVDEGGDFLIEG